MEKLQSSETENEANISSKSNDTDRKEQKNVKSNVSEHKINSDEQHLKNRDDVLSDEFLADLLTRNPTSDTNSANFEVKVPKSATESVIQSTDGIVETCTNGRNTIAECSVQTFGQNKTSDASVNESFSCPSEKNETEIIKEIVIEEAPQSDVVKEPLQNQMSKKEYREESLWTDDEDSSTSDSSSSESDTFFETILEKAPPKKMSFVKTKGELGLDDLPPIEDLAITVRENEMTLIGKVHAIVDTLVVVHALKNMKPLDLDSVLFLSHELPLGRIFDVFGPVSEPFYSIRFNSIDQINERGIQVGTEVFFAPEKSDITSYVFVEALQNQKGSDASWKHNNEPPEEFLDYSDDEKEKSARSQRRAKNRNKQFSSNNNDDAPSKRPFLANEDSGSNFIPPPRPAPRQNNFQNSPHRFTRPNPFQSRIPPLSPSPSVCSLMPQVRVHNSFRASPQNQHQRLIQPQNLMYRSSTPMLLSPYQQPHVFGQVTVLNPLSPALQSPSPLPSPMMNNIPALIPASPFSPVPPQNYFGQAFSRSPSPAAHQNYFNQAFPRSPSPAAPQNYFNQAFPRTPSPANHTLPLSPNPWLPNRSNNNGNIPPSRPLTVQIPNMNGNSPFPSQYPPNRGPVFY